MDNFVLDAAKELENATTKINTKNSTEKAKVKADDMPKLPVGKNATIINGTSTESSHLNSTVKPTVTTLKPEGDGKNSTSTKLPPTNGTTGANSVRFHC